MSEPLEGELIVTARHPSTVDTKICEVCGAPSVLRYVDMQESVKDGFRHTQPLEKHAFCAAHQHDRAAITYLPHGCNELELAERIRLEAEREFPDRKYRVEFRLHHDAVKQYPPIIDFDNEPWPAADVFLDGVQIENVLKASPSEGFVEVSLDKANANGTSLATKIRRGKVEVKFR